MAPRRPPVKSSLSNTQEHQSIFHWLKYHLRRPCEAIALHKIDYDQGNDVFIIRRSISNKILVKRTKTGVEHAIPSLRNICL